MDKKINVQLSNKEKQALSYILGESLEENDNNITFAQKIKNVAKKGLLTASLVLALLPNLNAQQTAQVTQEFVKCTTEVNVDKSQENINQQQKLFQMLKQSGIIQENKDGTITIKCISEIESAGSMQVQQYMGLCRGMGYVPIPTRSIKMIDAQYDRKKGIYTCSVTLKKVQTKQNNNATFENKQYNNMDKKQLYESIMTSVSKEVKKALANSELNESRTPNKDIENYIKSWLKYPSNSREMYEVLGAIVNGMKAALDYRTDEGYMDQNRHEYNSASDYLDDFIGHCESSIIMREEIN